jgi:hypothetical protein
MKKNKCISLITAFSIAAMLTGCSVPGTSSSESTDDKISIQKDGNATATDANATLSSADLF